ncbi:MAG TPA: hypothetical protein VE152_09725, partial [Acidimicrobiales bacterium]|nr:hypothetical protein [Acidimicrobiales bacterium]
LVAAHGHMMFLGFDLGKTAIHAGGGFLHSLPYWLLIAVCIGLQYLQMRQMTSRTPQQQEGTAAQMQKFQKFMPLFFGIIYIEIPAGVNIYFLVSSLFRLGQQELMFRYDPQIKGQLATTKKDGKVIEVTERPSKAASSRDGTGQETPGGLRGTLRAARSGLRELGSGAGGGGGAEDQGSWGRARGTTSREDAGAGRPRGDGGSRGGSNRPASTARGEGNGAGGSRRARGEGQASRGAGGGGRTGSQGGRSGTGRSSTERKGSSSNGGQRRSRDQEVAGVRGAGGDQRGRSSGGKGTGSETGDKGSGSNRSQNRSRSKRPRRPR